MKTESEQLISYLYFMVCKENLPTSPLFTDFLTKVALNLQVY